MHPKRGEGFTCIGKPREDAEALRDLDDSLNVFWYAGTLYPLLRIFLGLTSCVCDNPWESMTAEA